MTGNTNDANGNTKREGISFPVNVFAMDLKPLTLKGKRKANQPMGIARFRLG